MGIIQNRLTIFLVVLFSLSVILINNGVEGFHEIYPHLQSVSAISVSDQHRTAYHFQPPRNWINGSQVLQKLK
ncbi:hypothetical protein Lal_00023260 [Lupinus albus]|nr:hypothetical protein Lal_00023260 [Lupinus albus]